MATEYTYKCKQCGNVRTSYNDISLSPQSLIECKAKCFESHRNWEKIGEVKQQPQPVAPVVAPPPPPPQQVQPATSPSSSTRNTTTTTTATVASSNKPLTPTSGKSNTNSKGKEEKGCIIL
eukprot:PhF_6_TR6825/c0_g1_i2/m.9821